MNPRRHAVGAAVSALGFAATASAPQATFESDDQHRGLYQIRHSGAATDSVRLVAHCLACLPSATMLKLVIALELVSADELGMAHKLVMERPFG